MGYILSSESVDKFLAKLSSEYRIFAPKRYSGGGRFSDTDSIRYGEISSVVEIEFNEKSSGTFKEVLTPITETLFYFTEEQVKESDPPKKGNIIFLRSCDLHAVKRQDEIYIKNGSNDYYYSRIRENTKFVLMGCKNAFENCFCVDMNSNRSENYDLSMETGDNDSYKIDCKTAAWDDLLASLADKTADLSPSFVTETKVRVNIPDNLDSSVASSELWNEYDSRCINCGRCTLNCPTCTCNTMQDIFYTDNGRAGERRRVWASCMVDGFTDVAGGACYRKKNGERMRFKVLHKVLDYKKRFGYHMCVGCGRCDDICPEYISFSNAVNKLAGAMEGAEAE